MNLLIDRELPESVIVGRDEYKIRSDFRISIMFEILMQDGEVPDTEKTLKALNLYYPIIPRNLDAAVNSLLWFYRCGKDDSGHGGKTGAKMAKRRVYSFEHDDSYIYAAFMSQYKIDLFDIEYMHWWKFRSLFNSLTSDNQFVKIMEYRSIDISPDMTKEQKRFYQKMKRLYALPLPKDEQQKQDAIENALLNGGDLTGIL